MFTRKIYTYEVTAVMANAKERTFEEIARVTYQSTKESKTEARKEFKRQLGLELRKGVSLEFNVVDTITYGCTMDEFMSVANPIVSSTESID